MLMKDAMSSRSITIAIQGIAIIGLAAAVVFTARSAEMAATAAASLVQIVDEPARNFYQQEVKFPTSCTSCTLSFAAVPAGKTLRITHAACYMTVADTNGVEVVSVISGTPVAKEVELSSTIQGNANTVIASSPIDLYSTAGSKPLVFIKANTGDIDGSMCTLVGYFVSNTD
jgi:hypothetical protein